MAVVPIRLHRYSHCYCIHSRTRHCRKLPELFQISLGSPFLPPKLGYSSRRKQESISAAAILGVSCLNLYYFQQFLHLSISQFRCRLWLWCLSFLLSKKINRARFLRSTCRHFFFFFFFFCLSIVHRIHRAPGLCLSLSLLLSSLRTPAAAPELSSCTHSWNPKCFSMILPTALDGKQIIHRTLVR
jgi:hypothetical protein